MSVVPPAGGLQVVSRAPAVEHDDDHRPLAPPEILLAGCPGQRPHGVTGFVVDRLSPGRQCVENDADQLTLAVYLDAVASAQSLDRHAVGYAAEQEFSTDAIVKGVIAALDTLRAPIR